VLAWVLGFKDAIRCAGCLAGGLHRERGELIAAVKRHVDHRDCWSAGWRHADGREAARGASCAVANAALGRSDGGGAAAKKGAPPADASVAGRWDAGDLGCGDLVLELRTRLQALRPGQLFELLARDPGAPADLPAWCGLTGHALVAATPPRYLIRRRAD
jgi:tRNA 2-thiouridine synthesizing protein A